MRSPPKPRVLAFVTGAAGLMGSRLAARLSREGEVVGTVRSGGAGASGPWRPIEWDCERPRVPEGADALADGVEWFVHAAFRSPEGTDARDHDAALRANVAMAANAARECRRLGARRALLLSSGSIYGGRDGAALTERSGIPPEGDLDAYGRSVQEVEGAFRSGAGAAELVVARLFFPYGPGQRPARLVPRIATRILRGEPVQLRRAADGEEGRPRLNPVFADDAVEAMARLLALSALPSPALAVNVCGPEAVTVRELAIRIARVLRRECHFERAPDGGPPRDLVGDGRLLRELIGFSGGRALSAGLQAALKDLTI